MIQRLINAQLPPFARNDHPVMRYTLQRAQRNEVRSRRWLRRLLGGLCLAAIIMLGYQVATNFGGRPLEETLNPLDRVFLILFWPLVIIQIGMRLAAFGATTGTLTNEDMRGTWETLKLTTDGAGLALRTRWAAVFYQLRYALFVVMVARVFFVVVALLDFTTFNGRYIDLLITGTEPLGRDRTIGFAEIAIGILVVALQMTAALVAPFTALAFDAALGTLLGVLVRGRWLGVLGQVTILLFRLAISAFALFFGAVALSFPVFVIGSALAGVSTGDSSVVELLHGWLGAFVGVTEGDMGLTLLYLPHANRMYADIDYGIFVGVAALLFVLLQAGAANLLLSLAIRRANRAEKK